MKILVRALVATACLQFLVSCSGAVSSDNASSKDFFTLQPGIAEAYSGVEMVFTITGGQPPYTGSSSNAVIAPIATNITTKSFSIVPQFTSAVVPVVISIFDSAGGKVEAKLNVNPNIISNNFTITPQSDLTGAQGASCGTGTTICSGGYGLVVVKLSSSTIQVANRLVRFDVEQGAFALLQNLQGTLTGLSFTTTTDATGTANATLRADVSAASQLAILRFTDVATGSIQRATFAISRGSGVLAVLPASASLIGPRKDVCSAGINFDFLVTGGTAPYSVGSSIPGVAFPLSSVVPNDGGRFIAQTVGQVCGLTTLTVVDSTGRVATATLDNKIGEKEAPKVEVQPQQATLTCGGLASFAIAGGTGNYPYAITSTSTRVRVTNGGRTFSIERLTPDTGINAPTTVSIGVSDGVSNAQVAVVVPPVCPVPLLGLPITITPSSGSLVCGASSTFTISGGSGSYAVLSNQLLVPVTAQVGNQFLVTRNPTGTINTAAPVPATALVSISVTDGTLNATLPLTVTNVCP